MKSTAFFVIILLATLTRVEAGAGRYSPPGFDAATTTEGVACYWQRQRLYCSRYCYWEVNGKRYCHLRERNAHPQGLLSDDLFYMPMK